MRQQKVVVFDPLENYFMLTEEIIERLIHVKGVSVLLLNLNVNESTPPDAKEDDLDFYVMFFTREKLEHTLEGFYNVNLQTQHPDCHHAIISQFFRGADAGQQALLDTQNVLSTMGYQCKVIQNVGSELMLHLRLMF